MCPDIFFAKISIQLDNLQISNKMVHFESPDSKPRREKFKAQIPSRVSKSSKGILHSSRLQVFFDSSKPCLAKLIEED